jgi:transcriptional regulator with XRE-family HTH domain
MENKTLGARIAKLRNINGMSQDELSQLVGISRPSLAQIEQGNRNIKVAELKRKKIQY